MKKRLSLLLCVLVLALSFAGCGNNKKAAQYNPQELSKYAEMIIGSFSQMDEAAMQQFKDASDLQINLMLMQSGLPVERDEFISMMDAWNAAIDECGAYIEHGEFDMEVDTKEATLITEAKYEDRTATIMFKFDEKSNMESMDVSAKYSKGEILQKAGLNTVLGMGTVFVVLIFLAFIISLFKYIPVITGMFKKQEKTEEVKAVSAAVPAAVETVDETDDLELVAVITAAIEAYTGTSSDEFVVRSIKRRPSNKWN